MNKWGLKMSIRSLEKLLDIHYDDTALAWSNWAMQKINEGYDCEGEPERKQKETKIKMAKKKEVKETRNRKFYFD